MISFSRSLLDWAFPPHCALCGAFGDSTPCDHCRNGFERLDAPLRFLIPEVDAGLAIYAFCGVAGEAVRGLKFTRRTDLAIWMAEELRAGLDRSSLVADVAVPVPVHWLRRAERGFNQSELLMERLALPRADLALRRRRPTRAQARLDPAARARNLTGAFVASGVVGKRVLLVDDVVTSGHTARECARALRAAGAASVSLLAFAASHPD